MGDVAGGHDCDRLPGAAERRGSVVEPPEVGGPVVGEVHRRPRQRWRVTRRERRIRGEPHAGLEPAQVTETEHRRHPAGERCGQAGVTESGGVVEGGSANAVEPHSERRLDARARPAQPHQGPRLRHRDHLQPASPRPGRHRRDHAGVGAEAGRELPGGEEAEVGGVAGPVHRHRERLGAAAVAEREDDGDVERPGRHRPQVDGAGQGQLTGPRDRRRARDGGRGRGHRRRTDPEQHERGGEPEQPDMARWHGVIPLGTVDGVPT